jgi:transcriptional regulator with XRE-family HTH domain
MERNFKENLRAELDFLGLTVKELSAKTGVAKGTLDCYLGIRASMPPADIAVKIAGTLGVSVEYLVSGKEQAEQNAFLIYNHTIRSIIQIILKLDETDNEVILELAKILLKRTERSAP